MAKAKEKVVGGGEGDPVNLADRVTVIATDKHPYAAKGEERKIAPAVAEKLLKKGWVTKSK